LATQLIEQGRTECRKYSWDFVRDAWIDTYRKLTIHPGETRLEISDATEEKIATR